jgi:hypothetical protein
MPTQAPLPFTKKTSSRTRETIANHAMTEYNLAEASNDLNSPTEPVPRAKE